MSLSELLKKREEDARTIGRKTVNVLTEAEAVALGATEANVLIVDECKLSMTTCVVNNVELKGEKVSDKNGKTYIKYALIGRDVATNATLRTWGAVEKGQKMFAIGDLAEFPCVHIPFGQFGYANGTFVQPTKPEGAVQSTSQAMAELWNDARQEGYAKAVVATNAERVVAKKTTIGG
jgi:hypothetical protein